MSLCSNVVVGLARCSTDRQDSSIPDQIAEITEWATENRQNLVRVFEDEGVSGSELDRPGVRALLRYLQTSKEKGTLVVWKRNRLARPDDPRAGLALEFQIEQLGWRIHYLQGPQSSGDPLMDAMSSLFEHHKSGQFLRDLSSDVVRGMARRAKEATIAPGRTPYGYAKELTSPGGAVRVVPRGQPHQKLKAEASRLVPGDPEEIEIVGWLFEQMAGGESSLLGLAKALNAKGAPAPSGGKWSFRSVKKILDNYVYLGDLVWNMRSKGKFFQIKGGKVVPAEKARRSTRDPNQLTRYHENDPKEWIVSRDQHEALVSRELFDTAQRTLKARSSRSRPYQRTTRLYPLSGLLFCGNCGAPMTGRTTNNGRKEKWRKQVYMCSNGPGTGTCALFSLRADRIEPVVLEEIRKRLLPRERGTQLKELIKEQLQALQEAKDPFRADSDRLRRRQTELGRKISQALENLGCMKGRAAQLLAGQVEEWASEQEQLEASIHAAESQAEGSQINLGEAVESALAFVEELATVGMESDAMKRRKLFHKTVLRLEVAYETVVAGKRQRHVPTGGRLELLDSEIRSVVVPLASGRASCSGLTSGRAASATGVGS